MYIKRDLERVISDALRGKKVVILYGSRQTGKTTALNYLLEIEQHQPNDPDLYFFLGDLLADMDRMDEAICYLNLGLQRTNNDPTLLYLLAYLHLERNERNLALHYLEDALQANPDYYKEFIEYNPEMITNDLEVMELIEKIKDKR